MKSESPVQEIVDWFMSLGQSYGVNPLIFGSIYVGAIPFFTLSVAWIVRNRRRGKQIAVPTLFAGFFFISAYLYLLVAGRNIPIWVYGVIVALLSYGGWSAYRSVTAKLGAADASAHIAGSD